MLQCNSLSGKLEKLFKVTYYLMKISLSQTAVYNKVNHEIYRHFTQVCFVKFWFCWLWFTSARGDVFNSLLVVQC